MYVSIKYYSEYLRNSICDSIMDVQEARSPEDSIFDNTNQRFNRRLI
jgi:hypothetical protein